jgi:hypothetical protein
MLGLGPWRFSTSIESYCLGDRRQEMAIARIGDWDIVARRTNSPISPLMNFLIRLLFILPEPPKHSSVTWTVRHIQTGEVRKITAYSEEEFATRLAAGAFD